MCRCMLIAVLAFASLFVSASLADAKAHFIWTNSLGVVCIDTQLPEKQYRDTRTAGGVDIIDWHNATTMRTSGRIYQRVLPAQENMQEDVTVENTGMEHNLQSLSQQTKHLATPQAGKTLNAGDIKSLSHSLDISLPAIE
ncbi:hypothetical protein [Desulfovibrio inopinatus]|uniref:hypothetical protein n=1 Tax=Desulfovibrio inopinatus TaxID=102109 RepID=UPI0003FF2EE5|nr:hypothetical protein [Desulfovibrio inopinatus]